MSACYRQYHCLSTSIYYNHIRVICKSACRMPKPAIPNTTLHGMIKNRKSLHFRLFTDGISISSPTISRYINAMCEGANNA